ncbi:hypothetical protein SPLC1_S100820 [Arthrospira platensis C1]|nr:hypothetical protein SPLC1_S100820 [Arthrospira platensis C1]
MKAGAVFFRSPTPGETRFLGEFLLPQEMAGEKPGF